MAISDFSKYFLYKYRYIIGYTAIGLLLAGLLTFAGLYVPGGLSDTEIASIVSSSNIDYGNISSLAVINLPYHALQDALLSLFGPSVFVAKLPSLILALLTSVGLILLLRQWFKPNISVLASLIAISTSQFLFIAQQGTPDVLYVFWPTVMLLLGTLITRRKKHKTLWKVLFSVAVALSLYTPLSIYMIIAISLAIAFHPHLRAIVRKLSRKRVVTGIVCALIILTPLILAVVKDPGVLLTLSGIPSEWPSLLDNIKIILQQYFLFWAPGTLTLITPVFGLGAFLLITAGIWQLIKTIQTTRSYLIIIWFLCLTPVIIVSPDVINVTFTLTVLLIASGLTSVITYWYRLFPRNPYARISGLVPIIILVTALIGSGVMKYVHGYHYNPSAVNLFSVDLKLLPKDTSTLVVSNDQDREFYKAVSVYHKNPITVVGSPTAEQSFVATKDAKKEYVGYKISKIITNDRAKEADRFYIYTKI